MKNIFVSAFAVILLWSCGSGEGKSTKHAEDSVTKAQPPAPYLSEEEKKKYHDRVVEYFNKTNFLKRFNGSILIAKNGVPVFELYNGYANFHKKLSLTSETPLQIASTSKPFTAAAVLQLVEQGKLRLDDPLTKFFPGFPYVEVTIRSLLNHRSGLPNYLYYLDDKSKWDHYKYATNEDILNTLFTWKVPPSYRPNMHFSYCNTNYVMLALVVEKITSQPFPQYMKKNFFDKFGMKNTFIATIGDTTATLSAKANGYEWEKDFSDGPYGDKNIYSTPQDLLKWDRAWYNGQVLSKAMTDSAYLPYSNERPSMHNYGLGWRLLFTPTHKKVIYHNGHWHGFNSAFARLIDEEATIIILSNKANNAVYPIARGLYNIFGNYDGKHEEGED